MVDKELLYGTLKKYFGYDSFREGQEELITNTLQGKDVLGIMPTSGGKSLCYQLPALLLDGMTIVVSPLVSLMKDQVDSLREMGIAAAYLNSTLSREEFLQLMDDMRSGQLKLLYIAPERIDNESFMNALRFVNVPLLVVDEAHCISQWGSDFRPSYQGVARLYDVFGRRPRVAAFTATATEPVQDDIMIQLRLQQPFRLVTGFDRSNLAFSVEKPADKFKFLVKDLNPKEASIIYCSTRKNVESVQKKLEQKGFAVTLYHAGLPEHERQRNQDDFLFDRKPIMVATNAFGMGIDKSNVRTVYHYNMPKNIESYYQETGRAGRDGLPAQAWMAYGLADVVNQRRMIDEGEAEQAFKAILRGKLDALLALAEATDCRRQRLLAYFGEASGPCGNCDNCLQPPALWDGTDAARKLLSTIYRVHQKSALTFGAGHIIDVLRGKDSDKVRQYGHESISTFGVGAQYSEAQLKAIMRQLLATGALGLHKVTSENSGHVFDTLTLTDASRAVLQGQVQVLLRESLAATRTRRPKATPANVAAQDLGPDAQARFINLKAWRSEVAKAHDLPAYVIFNDATLVGIAQRNPQTLADLHGISGIGAKKLEAYGAEVLRVIQPGTKL